ncbi:unnamed protein product [Auanema sp. JU1783]|nr:unnamed protein product [Auanema sp. JU1783]
MPGPLSTVGEGLLGTHVLWEDIEVEVQKALGTTATFGSNRKVTNIGEGIGFLSRICLINPDWQNASPNLPKKFIVKIISQLSMIEMDGVSSVTDYVEMKSPELLKIEIDTYSLFNKYGDESFAIGKILGYRTLDETNNSKGFFIMEYIENVEPITLYRNISIDNCHEVLRIIAKWQAVSLKHREEFQKYYQNYFLTNLFGRDVVQTTCNQTIEGLKDVDHPQVQNKLEKLQTIVNDLCTDENLKMFDELCQELNMKEVFAHFDLWSPNVLWGSKDNGELFLKAIVDYQLVCFTNPMIDFLMFLVCNINADVRRSHTKQLIQDFHGYLTAEMGGENPFTIEQLEKCYKRVFPLGVLLIYAMVGPIYLSEVQKNPKKSDEITEIFEKKIIATLDEVITVYDENKKL